MKIRTFDSNLQSALAQDTSIPDRNLPVYVTDYTVRASAPSVAPRTQIVWSTVGFIPSYEDSERILHLSVCSRIKSVETVDSLTDLTYVFDFSSLGNRFINQFNISLKGPLEGYITYANQSFTLSAMRYIWYEYDAPLFQLLVHVRALPPVDLDPEEWRTLYLHLSIKDDVNDEDYPSEYPLTIANIVHKIPIDTPYKGSGIRFVVPMFICCPDELKTMQLSSIDPETEGAFNPIPEIQFLLDAQGIAVPSTFNIEFIDADANPISEDDPIPWKLDANMRQVAYVLQVLYSVLPLCTVIVLYSYAGNETDPNYLRWLTANVDSYDIVLQTTYLVATRPWTLDAFNQTAQRYDDLQRLLYTRFHPFVVASGNLGTEETLTYPNPLYDFNYASLYSVGVGAFQLLRNLSNDQYSLAGPYEASPNSSGGYSNKVARPPMQYGLNLRSLYGRPDLAGYFGYYLCSINPPALDSILGTQFSATMLATLFGMVMDRTQRREWDFKFILYRKGLTLIDEYFEGQNMGTLPYTRYNAVYYQFWNPLIGMGNLNGRYLLDICSLIRNFQVVQISSWLNMNNPVSFVNAMPPNPFGDLINRQPCMGPSSIFSLFYIKRVDGNDPPQNDEEPIVGNNEVYFVDLTERYALSYAIDDDGKWFVMLSKVNYGSSAQKWILTFATEPTSTSPIYAFETIVIAPKLQPQYSLTSKWNAGQSSIPNAPSIAYAVPDPEFFVLCTDPASDKTIADIESYLANDITGYSYYVNFGSTLAGPLEGRGDTVYLNNADFVGMDSESDEIYAARNRAFTQNVVPKWGTKFDPYPQWVLVPIPSTSSNTANVPYQPELLLGGQFMIFNTVLQSYLYVAENLLVPPERPEVYLKPISSSITDIIPFSSFVFTLSDTIIINPVRSKWGSLFKGDLPITPGLPPNTRIDPFLAEAYVYNWKLDTNVPTDLTRLSFSFVKPTILDNSNLEIVRSQGDVHGGEGILLYWVFKKYILTQTTPCRWFAYNDNADRQPENSNLALTAYGSEQNVDDHAPSFQAVSVVDDVGFYWNLLPDTTIQDLNEPPSPASVYGLLNEGLSIADPTATELIINTLLKDPREPNVVYGLGVLGTSTPPQPSILRTPIPQDPNALRWNVTMMNAFFTPPYNNFPGPIQRKNYFYTNTIYTLYTLNPIQTSSGLSGFLSSASNDGAAPSLVGNGIAPVMLGDKNTMFLLLPFS